MGSDEDPKVRLFSVNGKKVTINRIGEEDPKAEDKKQRPVISNVKAKIDKIEKKDGEPKTYADIVARGSIKTVTPTVSTSAAKPPKVIVTVSRDWNDQNEDEDDLSAMGEDQQSDLETSKLDATAEGCDARATIEHMRRDYLNDEYKAEEDPYSAEYKAFPDAGSELSRKPKFARRFNKPQEFKISEDHEMDALKLLLQQTVDRTVEMEKVVVDMQTWTQTIEAKLAMQTQVMTAISGQLDMQKAAIMEGQSQQKTMMAMLSAINDKLPDNDRGGQPAAKLQRLADGVVTA